MLRVEANSNTDASMYALLPYNKGRDYGRLNECVSSIQEMDWSFCPLEWEQSTPPISKTTTRTSKWNLVDSARQGHHCIHTMLSYP